MKRIASVPALLFSSLLAAQNPGGGDNPTTRNFYFSNNPAHVFHHEGWTVRTAGAVTGSVLHDSYIGAGGTELLSDFDAEVYAAKHEIEWMLAKAPRIISPDRRKEELRTASYYYAAESGKVFHHPGWNEKMLGIYLQYRQEKLYHNLRGQYLLRSQSIHPFMVDAEVPLWSLSPLQYYYLPQSFSHSALYLRMSVAADSMLPAYKVDPRLMRNVSGTHHSTN